MPAAKVQANVLSFSPAINACTKGQRWQRVLALFRTMPHAKVEADVVSFNATISACEKGDSLQKIASCGLFLLEGLRFRKWTEHGQGASFNLFTQSRRWSCWKFGILLQLYIYIYSHMYTYIYMCIYIYIHIGVPSRAPPSHPRKENLSEAW